MHFMDPKELGGLHVIGRNNAALGVVEGIYADIRSGYPQWAAASPGGGIPGVGRTMLHTYAAASANQMS
jgi:hypothetical protein